MRASQLYASLALLLSSATAGRSTHEMYRLAPPSWIENLAVRQSGSILVSTPLPNGTLYEIDPFTPEQPTVKEIRSFSGEHSVMGITETTPDTFFVATSNFSILDSAAPALTHVWRVAFPGPQIELVSTPESVRLPNGLTTLNPLTILLADSLSGTVTAINTRTGSYNTTIQDPLMAAVPGSFGLGVNGVKVRGNELYFTNTAQAILGKITVNEYGTPVGKAVKIAGAETLPPLGEATYDDFILDRAGEFAYAVVGNGNSLAKISLHDGTAEVVAGNLNQTTLAQPTAVAWGRTPADWDVLYVTTAGAAEVPVYVDGQSTPDGGVGGQLVAVQPAGWKTRSRFNRFHV